MLDAAKRIEHEIVKHRRFFHQNAETGWRLPATTEYIMKELNQIGCEPKEICDSGVVVAVGGKRPGKTFLLRGDTDALPVKEETKLPYKALNGNMHACGHDFHAAMLLGTAKLLKENENEIHGTVKLMFQPAEEIAEGAKSMIDAGVLQKPNVDAAMMIHIFSGLPIPKGHAAFFQAGPCFASIDIFDINIQGKGGHGAMPDVAVDPLVAMSHIHLGIQEINSRELTPGKFLVAVAGQMNGGSAMNIIPDTASIKGTIRTFDKNIRTLAKTRIRDIAQGIAKAYRCKARVNYSHSTPALENNQSLLDSTFDYTKRLLGQDKVLEAATVGFGRLPGSEDFAFVSEKVPSTVIGLGACVETKGIVYPQHHPKVMFDESILHIGTAIYANCAIRWLNDNK